MNDEVYKNDMQADFHNDSDGRYLVFQVGKHKFAISLLSSREVLEYEGAQGLSHSKDYFDGIMNLRGEIIGVVDLRTKLGIPREELTKKVAIVLNNLDTPLAVVVDSLNCVDIVDEKNFHPPHHQDNFLDRRYIKGIYRKGDEFISLIDLQGLLDDADISKVA